MTDPVDPDAEARLDQELLNVDGVAPKRPDPVTRAAESRLDQELYQLDRDPPALQPAKPTTPWVTYLLIVANLVAFGLEVAAGADATSPTAQKLIEVGGNFAPLTLH